MKLVEKLWNWGHLEGSHNQCTSLDCKMSPEEFAREYGIERSFIVSYGGNIQPPFDTLAERFRSLKEVKWSVLGDAGSPLPEAELGYTEDILACVHDNSNITGGAMDDFFSPTRMQRFAPEVLHKTRKRLNENGLDFWCVLYEHQLEEERLAEYLECFDGVTFWIWQSSNIVNIPQYIERFFALTQNKKRMLGIYLWDYAASKAMDGSLFEEQLKKYFCFLREKSVDGVIFCSNTVGDADLDSNRILKAYISQYGQDEI